IEKEVEVTFGEMNWKAALIALAIMVVATVISLWVRRKIK
ncbi:unnamed protein product, partial [marine sediment metagenome]